MAKKSKKRSARKHRVKHIKKGAAKKTEQKKVALPKSLEKYLLDKKIKYNVLGHKTVYTAFDTAQTLKVDPKSIAKTLIVQLDKDLALAVIPGNCNLDIGALKKVVNTERKKANALAAKKLSLVTEKTISNKLTKTPGAVTSFGELYSLATFVDKALLKQPRLIVNGGSFTVSLEMSGSAFEKAASPVVGSFSKKRS